MWCWQKLYIHRFTYFLAIDSLQKSVVLLDKCATTIQKYYGGIITSDDTEIINSENYDDSVMAKNTFLKVLVDCFYVEDFRIDRITQNPSEQSIITIYKTGVDTTELLGKLGINMINAKMIDETTRRMEKEEIDILTNGLKRVVKMF